MTTEFDALIAELRPAVYELSRDAGCGDPDNSTSPGAMFLTGTWDSWMEVRDQYDDREGMVMEVADGSVPIGTHLVWQTYVDLCAYREDIDDYRDRKEGTPTGDARTALYLIAERLVAHLEFEYLAVMAEQEYEDG